MTDNATLSFNRSDGYSFGGIISGSGALEQNGTGGTTLVGTELYTGATTVNAGTLLVNGSIASSSALTVNAGGTIGGTGTLPSTTISGGTLAPGNGIGTIAVQGNLAFSPTSTYLVDISPTASDRTNVTGTATLAGTVHVCQSRQLCPRHDLHDLECNRRSDRQALALTFESPSFAGASAMMRTTSI